MTGANLRVATRGSELALWQTRYVAGLLDVAVEEIVVKTTGDRQLDVPIEAIGGQGVFVKEVQAAVLDGRADLAVHSAKDLTSLPTHGLTIAAVPPRVDPRDVLVGSRLAEIPEGGVVASGSVRRRAQLANLRPDLRFTELRGSIATRLDKADGVDAIVMAAAALHRLQLTDRIAEVLEPNVMLPQVGQGALAIECRSDDLALIHQLRKLQDPRTRIAVDAERSFLATLGGSCDLPVGAYATVSLDGLIALTGLIAASDGASVLREAATGTDAEKVGVEVAEALLASGGAALLKESTP